MTSVWRLEMCITDVSHWMAANRLTLNADKTELLRAGSTCRSGPSIQLGDEIITASDHVRLLCVTISSDLSPERHAAVIISACYELRQLRRVRLRRLLDTESAKALVHAFVTSRVDGCNTVFAESSKTITDSNGWMNAAARVTSGTRKFDRGLTRLLHAELHWLDIPQRIQCKLWVIVHRCLQDRATQYFIDCCTLTSVIASRPHLRSDTRHQLDVPRHCCSRFGRRAFSTAIPRAWNLLPDHLRDPSLSSSSFTSSQHTGTRSAVEAYCVVRFYKSTIIITIIILRTYLLYNIIFLSNIYYFRGTIYKLDL